MFEMASLHTPYLVCWMVGNEVIRDIVRHIIDPFIWGLILEPVLGLTHELIITCT